MLVPSDKRFWSAAIEVTCILCVHMHAPNFWRHFLAWELLPAAPQRSPKSAPLSTKFVTPFFSGPLS